ncbi:cutinase family protein [Gordonia pseudamarae]|uniref:Cutinase family protein n=2 Tax=Gordoniaceae TaxID=85026 RepID=A0ABX6INP9_9ACTN|nr:cutinase family protein [Gordonia pseudamarae]
MAGGLLPDRLMPPANRMDFGISARIASAGHHGSAGHGVYPPNRNVTRTTRRFSPHVRAPATLVSAGMKKVSTAVLACLATILTAAATIVAAPQAQAAPCPAVQVIYARGTTEKPAPLGATGQSFLGSLQAQLPGRAVAGHGIRYAASGNYARPLSYLLSVRNGVLGTQSRIISTIRRCPDTKIVLGGFSQGAAIVGYAISSDLSLRRDLSIVQFAMPTPLPPSISDHIAAVVLFSQPSDNWLGNVGAPPIRLGAEYADKSMRYCLPLDNICDGSPFSPPNPLHLAYVFGGVTYAGAAFAAGLV